MENKNNAINGNWEEMKGKVKEKWGKLTNSDMTAIKGDQKQLASKLSEHYGYDKDRAEREVGSFLKSCEADQCNTKSVNKDSSKNQNSQSSRL